MKKKFNLLVLFLLFVSLSSLAVFGCTNILVSKGASADGSVIITYSCDGEFHPHLSYIPAQDHKKGDFYEIRDWKGKLRGKIPQPPHTYAVVGLMNEYQLAIGETTFGGRKELYNPEGLLHYWTLMRLALQRAKTAREAIKVIADLVEMYGYNSPGESFSIADPNEVWIMEIIGTGKGGHGAIWVARRVPEGYICAHANKSRISTFPKNDPQNCMYSPNVISFAVEKGYYDTKSGKPFSFCDAYCPSNAGKLRYTATRVWSIFRRAAPSLNLSPDYNRGKKGGKPYPLWIKPDKKLSVQDVISLMRDHYEGTPYDMTKGIDSGPFGCPERWRPIEWKVDGVTYAWERPISTQQTGFSFVSQSRSWLPNPIGGIYWYGVDNTYTTCYIPLYCSITEVPPSFTIGQLSKFSWDSAWWIFNLVSNFADLKYSYMIKDIQKVQHSIEGNFFALQPAIEQTALTLMKKSPDLMKKFLTDYCVSHGEMTVKKWKDLAEYLITKYNDGYVQDKNGRPHAVGYPEEWLRKVLKERPNQFKLPQNKKEEKYDF